mmetsp:Transcript_17666/g.38332  ORF Transcript_17666/g.38332 Transcript_17666/m.38332 type:complete len:261 (+) Transcript_17666:107-889(+)
MLRVRTIKALNAYSSFRRWMRLSRCMSSGGGSSLGLLEIRRHVVRPDRMEPFTQLVDASKNKSAAKPHGWYRPITGGYLNEMLGITPYESIKHFESTRVADEQTDAHSFETAAASLCTSQHSEMFVPAVLKLPVIEDSYITVEAEIEPETRRNGFLELRRYHLVPGYTTVPTVLAAFRHGLPEKIEAGRASGCDARAVFFGHTEVGVLNQFVELWWFRSLDDGQRAREASRKSEQWRGCVHEIASVTERFHNTYYKCVVC